MLHLHMHRSAIIQPGGCVHRCPAPSLQLAAFQTLDLGRRRKAQAVQRGQLVRVPKRGLIASASLGAAASPASQPEPACFAPLRAVAAAAVAVWHAVAARMAEAVLAARQRLDTPPPDPAAINAQIRSSVKQARMLSAVAPFAAASTYTGTTSNTLLLLTRAVASFIKLYLLLLFLRVLLSWFPAFNWERQPWLTLRQLTDPYLNLFRGLVPPLLGTIDFTPLLGFFILQFLSGTLEASTADDESSEYW